MAKFAQEARDLSWAPKTEEALSADIEKEDSVNYNIRNVECRRTVCAVEVSSPRGQRQPLLLSSEEDHALGLYGAIGWHAFETRPSAGSILVSVLFFTRAQ
jgi:hypothetical protein